MDLIKATELRDSKLKLEVAKAMEKKGNENDCVYFLWISSDLIATSRLVEIYKSGKMVDEGNEEFRRLFGIATGLIVHQK